MPSFPLNFQFQWRIPNLTWHPLPMDTNSLEQRYPSAWPPRRANLLFPGNFRFEEAREINPDLPSFPDFPILAFCPGLDGSTAIASGTGKRHTPFCRTDEDHSESTSRWNPA